MLSLYLAAVIMVMIMVLSRECQSLGLKTTVSSILTPASSPQISSLGRTPSMLTLRAGNCNGLFFTIVESYSRNLEKRMWVTKITSSGVIAALGDIMMQRYLMKSVGGTFDIRRTIIFTIMGAFYIAPIIHAWFEWLNSLTFPTFLSDTKTKKVLSMLVIDQTLGAVLVNMGFFFGFELVSRLYPDPALLAPLPISGALIAGWNSCNTKMWSLLVANWSCWPLINFLNFFFIPLKFRLLFTNVASLLWNVVLSSIANK